MEGVVQVLFIFGTIVTGDDNGCAGGETHKKAHNQIYHLSGRTAYGSKGSGSHESSHHYCVRCVVKLLKQRSQHNWKKEKQQLLPDDTFCNLVNRLFFCAHKIPPCYS